MRFVFFFITTVAIAGDFTTSLGDAYPYTVSAIATDAAGNTYVVGSRQLGADAFRIGTDGTVGPIGTSFTDVFISKLDPNGKLPVHRRLRRQRVSTREPPLPSIRQETFISREIQPRPIFR